MYVGLFLFRIVTVCLSLLSTFEMIVYGSEVLFRTGNDRTVLKMPLQSVMTKDITVF